MKNQNKIVNVLGDAAETTVSGALEFKRGRTSTEDDASSRRLKSGTKIDVIWMSVSSPNRRSCLLYTSRCV